MLKEANLGNNGHRHQPEAPELCWSESTTLAVAREEGPLGKRADRKEQTEVIAALRDLMI